MRRIPFDHSSTPFSLSSSRIFTSHCFLLSIRSQYGSHLHVQRPPRGGLRDGLVTGMPRPVSLCARARDLPRSPFIDEHHCEHLRACITIIKETVLPSRLIQDRGYPVICCIGPVLMAFSSACVAPPSALGGCMCFFPCFFTPRVCHFSPYDGWHLFWQQL